MVNFVGHFLFNNKESEIIPQTLLMLASYLIAIRLTDSDIKILILLITFECFFGFMEFTLGVKTFFSGLEANTEVRDASYLYYRSVFGLSDNSSSFAVKVLLAYLLVYFIHWRGRTANVVKIILLAGLLLSFNRTSIAAVIFFHGLNFAMLFSNTLKRMLTLKVSRMNLYLLLGALFAIVILIVLVFTNIDLVINQFTRGTQRFEMTGRERTWVRYIDFISQNLWLGNGSHKYYIFHPGDLRPYHAHNSYLQMLATHGIIVFLLYLLLIVVNIRKINISFVLTLALYSLSQYGIFWGISLTDIILFTFLFKKNPTNSSSNE